MADAKPGTIGDLIKLGRALATVKLLARTGATDVEFAYDDELPEGSPTTVLWWAKGNWQGTRVISEHFPYPDDALFDLAMRVVNGGTCRHCGRITILGVLTSDEHCCFALLASTIEDASTYKWVRDCEIEAHLAAKEPK